MVLASMPMSSYGIKDIVRPFEFGGVTRFIRSGIINWRPGKFFFDLMLQSHEGCIQTIYSCLRITGMALSNESDFP
jgi:hypothetical protein